MNGVAENDFCRVWEGAGVTYANSFPGFYNRKDTRMIYVGTEQKLEGQLIKRGNAGLYALWNLFCRTLHSY